MSVCCLIVGIAFYWQHNCFKSALFTAGVVCRLVESLLLLKGTEQRSSWVGNMGWVSFLFSLLRLGLTSYDFWMSSALALTLFYLNTSRPANMAFSGIMLIILLLYNYTITITKSHQPAKPHLCCCSVHVCCIAALHSGTLSPIFSVSSAFILDSC